MTSRENALEMTQLTQREYHNDLKVKVKTVDMLSTGDGTVRTFQK